MKQINVVIDARERGKDRTEKLEDKIDDSKTFEFAGYERLDAGDIIFSTDEHSIFVEVKTPSDFSLSAIDGRSSQLIKLNEVEGFAFIYVLGNPFDVDIAILEDTKRRHVDDILVTVKSQITRVIDYEAEAYVADVPVIYAGRSEWNKLLQICKKLLINSDLSKKRKTKSNLRQVDALCALGVQPKKARMMLEGRSLLDVLTIVMNEKTPNLGKGIGKGTIEQLRATLVVDHISKT